MNTSRITADWPGKEAGSLLWLASFPRSGNTFTRILLANYFATDAEAYDINKLRQFITADTANELWQGFVANEAVPGTLEWTWSARSRFFDYYRKLPKVNNFAGLKTHTANVKVWGSDAFNFRKTDRVIYIVRHPLDVLLSYADYNGRDIDEAIGVMTTSGACVRYDHLGGIEVRGAWAEHVSSWLNTTECPVLLVRYEELRSNTEQVLRSMLSFLGAPIIAEKVPHAVEASRFDKIRAQEAAHRFVETPDTTMSGTFFRKGTSFQWLRDLSPEQAYRMADACEPIMSKLGYTHPRDVFFDGRNALQPIQLHA